MVRFRIYFGERVTEFADELDNICEQSGRAQIFGLPFQWSLMKSVSPTFVK